MGDGTYLPPGPLSKRTNIDPIEKQADRLYESLDEIRSIAAAFLFDDSTTKSTVKALKAVERQLAAIEQTLTKAANDP